MSTQDRPPSSPAPGGSLEADLAYYKTQYEQLEGELQEFQASSRELESELEKDIEASEKRERQLKEKLEGMGFEVEEWKAKYKQSKTEANGAQNALQKEITTLRETNRSMQLRLRDIEVANDDFERQARNQNSSLEDLEQKYNISIERGVMFEEEIKAGEQEREQLRIENQRLRDELADISIEADIVKEKLRIAEDTIARHRTEKTHAIVTADHGRSRSPVSETSTSATTVSSPTTSTPPPTKSNRTSATTPPSPNFAEFMDRSKDMRGVGIQRKGSIAFHDNTPRPRDYGGPQRTRHNRAPSMPWSSASGRSSPTRARRPTQGHSYKPSRDGALPRSGSLYQIRGLIGKMQKLEARVHNVRSKLPAPTNTPPRASPRGGSAQSNHSHQPSNTTVRSAGRQRTSGSTNSSVKDGEDNNTTGISRLNFGASTTKTTGSISGFMSAPSDTLSASSRPTSRASELSGVSNGNGYGRPVSRGSGRPPSRGSNPGRGTPLGHFSTNNTTEARRPRTSAASSSFWNNDRYGAPTRTRTRNRANTRSQFDDLDEPGSGRDSARDRIGSISTPITRSKTNDFSRSTGSNGSGIPTPGTGIPTPSGLPRRKSVSAPKSRRPSMDHGAGGIPPVPPILQRPGHTRQLSEVGETW
ncbi:NADH:ubiquinone oxidoreductase [Diplodia seriata]|uniref:NADH:ubiquinone oxidoreductase n=1 Tax=Diplodia seriata TaxID=420778 RepID=A0A1S8B974_9PEZI|nr:Nuclear distribution protein nudE-like protein 1 [Diplodia seriata]